ncbi:hypothetical protein Tco_0584678, partial [Tanacetum coccineum]
MGFFTFTGAAATGATGDGVGTGLETGTEAGLAAGLGLPLPCNKALDFPLTNPPLP